MLSPEHTRKRKKFYEDNKEVILKANHKYAVIETSGKITYFDSKNDVYKAHPILDFSKGILGDTPLLIDIKSERKKQGKLEKKL